MIFSSPDGDKVILVDLQLVRYSTPALDLAYFLGSSTSPEYREKELDKLLEHYHSCLTGHLKRHFGPEAGSTVYPFDAFAKDFKECFIWAWCVSGTHCQVGSLIMPV